MIERNSTRSRAIVSSARACSVWICRLCGDVAAHAHHADDVPCIIAQRHFRRGSPAKLGRTVRRRTRDLLFGFDDRACRRRGPAGPAHPCARQRARREKLINRLAEDPFPRKPASAQPGRVGDREAALVVFHVDIVRNGVDDRAQEIAFGAHLFLRLLVLGNVGPPPRILTQPAYTAGNVVGKRTQLPRSHLSRARGRPCTRTARPRTTRRNATPQPPHRT